MKFDYKKLHFALISLLWNLPIVEICMAEAEELAPNSLKLPTPIHCLKQAMYPGPVSYSTSSIKNIFINPLLC
mgnify:CR=1 FL=1